MCTVVWTRRKYWRVGGIVTNDVTDGPNASMDERIEKGGVVGGWKGRGRGR